MFKRIHGEKTVKKAKYLLIFEKKTKKAKIKKTKKRKKRKKRFNEKGKEKFNEKRKEKIK
ncbi:MAG: hypothetical protein FWE78_02685 [Methanimicrococcus sp.]|nr:hypothetical protein [Methanimicrococcus sp.]